MKSLSAALDLLVAARVLAFIPYASIRIVEDHTAPTFKKWSHFGTYPIQLLEATLDDDEPEVPFLGRVLFPVETMPHLPSPVAGGGTNSLQRRISFSLINAVFRDQSGSVGDVYGWLTETGRLDRAELVLQQLLLPPSEFRRISGDAVDAHLVYLDGGVTNGEVGALPAFTGEIDTVASVGSEIQIVGKSTLPAVDWKLVPDTGADARDAGLRLPYPLGSQAIVRCVNLVVGASTTLERRLPIGGSDPHLVISAGFPSSGTAMFGAEAIAWTGITNKVLTGVSRAQKGTAEADHIAGTPVVEVAAMTLGVASYPIASVTALYINSPPLNTVVEVSKLAYSVDYNDESTAPGDTGDGITTVGLSALQIRGLLHELYADAAVIQQATYQDDDEFDLATQNDDMDLTDSSTVTTGAGASGTWSGVAGATPGWIYGSGGTRKSLRLPFTDGSSLDPLQGVYSVGFEMQVDMDVLSTPITLGLTATGGEGILEGFTDGMIVAQTEIAATGNDQAIVGPVFQAVAGTNASALASLVLDVVISEIPLKGSPAVDFDIDRVRLVIVWLDDIESIVDTWDNPRFPDTLANVQSGDASDTFDALWVDLGDADDPNQTVDGGDPWILVGTFASNPYAIDYEIAALKLHFKTSSVRHADDTGTIFLTFVGDGGAWGGLLTSLPSVTTHNATGGSTTPNDTTLDLTSLLVAGAKMSDFLTGNKALHVEAKVNSGPPNGSSEDTLLEFHSEITTVQNKTASAGPTRVLDSQIQSAAGGVGLEFYAVCDGPVAPDATYDESSGDLIFHPSDLARWWLRVPGGYAAGDIDETTFDAAVTNLVGYEWGFDARNLGATWEEILLRMGYEARANFCRPSGGDWQMQTALASFLFATPTVTIDSTSPILATGKDDNALKTRLVVNYAFDPRHANSSNRAYAAVQTTVAADAAVVTREAAFGIQHADPMFLLCHTSAGATGVTDWRKYMEHELGRFSRVLSCRVDHWQGFVLELGDVVNLTVSNGVVSETVKARVIQTEHNPNTGIQVRFVEVL